MPELMLPLRPYILPACYQWIVESGKTPYLLVDANYEDVAVPQDYIRNGEIVLNLMPQAIRDLEMTQTYVSFRATFAGKIEYIYVPMGAIMTIYAAETGHGMPFEEEGDTLSFDSVEPAAPTQAKPKKASHLRLVDDE